MSVVDFILPLKLFYRLYQKRLLSDLEANLTLEKLPDQIKPRDYRILMSIFVLRLLTI